MGSQGGEDAVWHDEAAAVAGEMGGPTFTCGE